MKSERAFEGVVGLACLALGVLVAGGALSSRKLDPAVGHQVIDRLAESGVESLVTGVLLNFRGYDTMLEVVVLVVAFWGTWSLRPSEVRLVEREPDPILIRTLGGMLPVLWLLAIYLLWAGASRPGGEFAAGAVLGASGVLTLLMGRPIRGGSSRTLRKLVVVVGVVAFLAAGLAGALVSSGSGDAWGYGAAQAKAWILVIEIAGAATIAFVLIGLFAGGLDRIHTPAPGEGI